MSSDSVTAGTARSQASARSSAEGLSLRLIDYLGDLDLPVDDLRPQRIPCPEYQPRLMDPCSMVDWVVSLQLTRLTL